MSISTFQQKIHMVHHPFPSFGSNHKSPIHPGLDRNSVGAPSSSCSTPGNGYKSHKSSPLLLKIQLHDLPKTQKKHPNHTRGINAWKMAYNQPTEVLCYRDPQTSPLSNPQSLQSVNSANKKSKFKHAWQPSFTVSFPPVPITFPSLFCFPMKNGDKMYHLTICIGTSALLIKCPKNFTKFMKTLGLWHRSTSR